MHLNARSALLCQSASIANQILRLDNRLSTYYTQDNLKIAQDRSRVYWELLMPSKKIHQLFPSWTATSSTLPIIFSLLKVTE